MKTPKHYNTEIQPVEVIDKWGLDFYLGNVLKYIARAGKKDNSSELEDLQKAKHYIEMKIERLTNKKYDIFENRICKNCIYFIEENNNIGICANLKLDDKRFFVNNNFGCNKFDKRINK